MIEIWTNRVRWWQFGSEGAIGLTMTLASDRERGMSSGIKTISKKKRPVLASRRCGREKEMKGSLRKKFRYKLKQRKIREEREREKKIEYFSRGIV